MPRPSYFEKKKQHPTVTFDELSPSQQEPEYLNSLLYQPEDPPSQILMGPPFDSTWFSFCFVFLMVIFAIINNIKNCLYSSLAKTICYGWSIAISRPAGLIPRRNFIRSSVCLSGMYRDIILLSSFLCRLLWNHHGRVSHIFHCTKPTPQPQYQQTESRYYEYQYTTNSKQIHLASTQTFTVWTKTRLMGCRLCRSRLVSLVNLTNSLSNSTTATSRKEDNKPTENSSTRMCILSRAATTINVGWLLAKSLPFICKTDHLCVFFLSTVDTQHNNQSVSVRILESRRDKYKFCGH